MAGKIFTPPGAIVIEDTTRVPHIQKEKAMALTIDKATRSTAVRPFTVEFLESELDDLLARVLDARLPEGELVADASQGVQLATIRALMHYWGTNYDFRRVESRLNAHPQFITEIDGLDIHFIHVKSRHEGALPLIITHGWPGSVIEMLNVIGPLTDPTAHGGSADDAFDVVIPSIPGYGFSGKPTGTGWDPARVARAWAVLMDRLGYTEYVAQGGDWGAIITDLMGVQAPWGLLGIHSNMPGVVPADISALLAPLRADLPSYELAVDERRAYEQLTRVYTQGIGYAVEMGLRPQSLYGLADSPVALAAWMLDHDALELRGHHECFRRREARWFTHQGRSPRQHHPHLADQHRHLVGPPVLGEQAGLLRRQGRLCAHCGECLPQGTLPGSEELGRGRLPQPHVLQRGRPGWPLRRLAGTAALHRRGPGRFPVVALTNQLRSGARHRPANRPRRLTLLPCGPVATEHHRLATFKRNQSTITPII